MAIYVVNKKSFRGEGVYVGRPSVLGNPFAIGKDGDRDEVIRKYRVWLWREVKARGKVFAELVRIKKLTENGNVNLICHCHPLKCHSDVVRACIEWMMNAGVE